MIRDLARVAAAGALGVVVAIGYTTFRVWDQGGRDERRPVDAIVVLGAAQYDGRPSPVFQARLDHAVQLYLDGVAPFLMVTGGKAHGDRTTEAEAGRAFALQRGVPDEAILVENRGRTTLESLRLAGAGLRERGLANVLFVSDRTHMLRVLRIARDQGIDGFGSPTTTSPVDADPRRRFGATVHEVAALGIYFLTGGTPLE